MGELITESIKEELHECRDCKYLHTYDFGKACIILFANNTDMRCACFEPNDKKED